MVMYVEWTHIDYRKLCCTHSYKVILVLYLGDKEPQKRLTSLLYLKSEDNCCINTLKWEMLLDITTDRARWRKEVKTDGVCKAFNQWYIAENTKSNKRQI